MFINKCGILLVVRGTNNNNKQKENRMLTVFAKSLPIIPLVAVIINHIIKSL